LIDTFGAMPLAVVRPRHVAEFIAEKSKTLGAATVGRDVSVLQAIFTSARREELVESNPAERAERPKLPPFRPQILEPAEVARVAKSFTEAQARVVFLTLVLTGVRHANMATTQRYLHLAGVVFRDEADALERRLLGGTNLYPSEVISADPARSATA
jgi:site-specific recombinase XerD